MIAPAACLTERTFAIPDEVSRLCARLSAHGWLTALVGGSVRDLVAGSKVKDWDVATAAPPAEVQRLFKRVVPTGLAHGTVTVLIDRLAVEVSTFRGSGSSRDGLAPELAALGPLLADLAHRDFTINAMAYLPERRQLVDCFCGRAAITDKRLAAVGDTRARLDEDPLRALRAIRFATTLGFELADELGATIPSFCSRLAHVSVERRRDELMRILGAPRPSTGLRLAHTLGLLEPLAAPLARLVSGCRPGEETPAFTHTLACIDATWPSPVTRLAALLHDSGKITAPPLEPPGEHAERSARLAASWLEELRCDRRTIREVVSLVGHHGAHQLTSRSDAALRRLIIEVGDDLLPALLDLNRADALARPPVDQAERLSHHEAGAMRVLALLETHFPRHPRELALNGSELMAALDLSPGPELGRLIGLLFDAVLEEPSRNDAATLRSLAVKLRGSTT